MGVRSEFLAPFAYKSIAKDFFDDIYNYYLWQKLKVLKMSNGRCKMQQYFSDVSLEIGDEYIFDSKQAHHAKNVIRLENEKVRIVAGGIGYFATYYSKGKDFVARIEKK